jgi:DNA-binding NtrC family response regulator
MTIPKPTVAVFNSSDECLEMLCGCLELKGYRCVKGHVPDIKKGETDFLALIEAEDPQVVVWDISLPYDHNWTFFQLVRSSEALNGRGVVVTTTHKPHLDELAGSDTGAIEIMGKPLDLDRFLEAVEQAMPR